MLFAFEFTIEATQIKVVKWNICHMCEYLRKIRRSPWSWNSNQLSAHWDCRIESLLTCILAVDAEILAAVLVVAAAESSGCAHLGDVREGSLIVQAVQTAIKSLDRFIF